MDYRKSCRRERIYLFHEVVLRYLKYSNYWKGVDGGREGLWREPLWTETIRIISNHQGEAVYDRDSPIFNELERKFPNEAWRAQDRSGKFRPLFRDYPNSWVAPGLLNLDDQTFRVTLQGLAYLENRISKSDLFIDMFTNHREPAAMEGAEENPFSIICAALIKLNRGVTLMEIYWSVMGNYRPGYDEISHALARGIRNYNKEFVSTPVRRLKNIMALMVEAGVLSHSNSGGRPEWSIARLDLAHRVSDSSEPVRAAV